VAEIPLRYGCNPHQGSAVVRMPEGRAPLRVLNGEPSYINVLDALTGWQLVRELAALTGEVAAASYKHVSPAGAALAGPLTDAFRRAQMLDFEPTSDAATAYVRARGADRVSSFGDAAAISTTDDRELAEILSREVSDLIVAPGYELEALEILKAKKRGDYLILEADPEFEPEPLERRDLFGIELQQMRNVRTVGADEIRAGTEQPLSDGVARTLVVATTALKYTQSNSVCVAWDGQVIGLAAGQQSRIHCTRLACEKAEKWMLQTHPRVLALEFPEGVGRPERTNAVDQYVHWDRLSPPERDALVSTLGYRPEPLTADERAAWFAEFEDLCMSSDAFIPFRDNVDGAASSGVRYVAHTGGSVRDASVREAARRQGVVVIETGVRCFYH
jgi:phosphoribosylaminoimidazolecarboxamide formyltransferase / IMP cyclohydrolase